MNFHVCHVVLLGLLLLALAARPSAGQATRPVADDQPALWIIGDSTVKLGNREGKGWGEVIDAAFDADRITIHNKAIGGRSSRTFRTEGRWDEVLRQAKPGDFVLMQFGHNDANKPDDPERPRGTIRGVGEETVDIINPQTKQPETVHTFGWYMRQYVREARAKGLIPIVCSYVPRAPRPGETPDPKLSSFGYYAKQVADEENAAFIDLYGRTARKYIKKERERPHSVKEDYFVGGERDYTHTVEAGARVNAESVVEGLRDLTGEAGRLKAYLRQ